MKKVLAVCLAIIMVVSAGVFAFAQGGFVSSPSGNSAPIIIEINYDANSCRPKIVVTAYADRETLDDKKEDDMNAAYDEIASNKDLTILMPFLKEVAISKSLNPFHFAVSDLFDISAYHAFPHSYCGNVTIKLSSETLSRFVALVHRTASGEWELIPNVILNVAEETITFSINDFSPFAIVVDTSVEDVPDTGNNLLIYIPAAIMVISGVSLLGVLISLKKKKQEA